MRAGRLRSAWIAGWLLFDPSRRFVEIIRRQNLHHMFERTVVAADARMIGEGNGVVSKNSIRLVRHFPGNTPMAAR